MSEKENRLPEGFYEENGCICKSGRKITNWVIKESRWEIRKRGEYEEDWIVLNIGVHNMESEVTAEIPMEVIQSGNIIKYLPNELMIFELSDAKRRWFIREYINYTLVGITKETVLCLSSGYSKVHDSYVYVFGGMLIDTVKITETIRIESELHIKENILQCENGIAWIKHFCEISKEIMPVLFLGAVISLMTPFLQEVGIDTGFVLYLVGETGTGKSSVAKLLTEVYEEKNYWTVSSDLADLRKCMNVVKDFLFLLDDLNKTETSRVRASKESKVAELIQQVSNHDRVDSRGLSSHFDGTLIITAEYALKNVSTMNRCVVLNVMSNLDVSRLQSLKRTQGSYIQLIIKFISWLCADKDKHMEVIHTLNESGLTKDTYNRQAYSGIARIERSENMLNIGMEFFLIFLQEKMKMPGEQADMLRKLFEDSIEHCIDDTRHLVRKEDTDKGREYIDGIVNEFTIDTGNIKRSYKKYKSARKEGDDKVIFFQSNDCVCITGDDLVRLFERKQGFQYSVSKKAISAQLMHHGMLKISGGEYSFPCLESKDKTRYYHIYINKIEEMMSGEQRGFAGRFSPLEELRWDSFKY